MSVIESVHADHGATFTERSGHRVVADYGRPERTHRAVRNVAGTIEMGYDVRIVTGPDRVSAVDDALTDAVPEADGRGTYGFVLEDGGIAAEAAVYNAAESDRLLAFCSPGRGDVLDAAVGSAATVTDATDDLAVFGVHGPQATEKIASVLSTGGGAPEPAGAFTRGTMGEEGVTVIATDAPTGEEGYEVVCDADDADRIFDTLVNRGLNAAPFGYRTWASLTLEAGTPLFSDIRGRDPAVLTGGDGAGERLLGLTAAAVPEFGAALLADGDGAGGDGEEVGTVTRALESPTLDEPIALAVATDAFDAVEGESGTIAASEAALPFVEGSALSGRRPEP